MYTVWNMAIKIALLNQKGGVGKTTNTINIGMSFHNAGYKTLLIDSDPQGSLRDWNEESEGKILPVITLDRPTLPIDIKSIEEGYQIILIDGAPQSSKLSGAAVRASDYIIIPVTPSPYDVWACSDIVEVVKQRIELTEGKLKAWFLISRAKDGTTLFDDVVSALKQYDIPVLNNRTIQREIYPQSASNGETVFCVKGKAAEKAQYEINLIRKEVGDIICQ